MKVAPTMRRKPKRDISTDWVEQERLETLSIFASKYGLDHDFTKVGSSADLGVFPSDEKEDM